MDILVAVGETSRMRDQAAVQGGGMATMETKLIIPDLVRLVCRASANIGRTQKKAISAEGAS